MHAIVDRNLKLIFIVNVHIFTFIFRCIDIEEIPFILVSNRVSIRKVDLRAKGGQTKYSEIVRGLRNTIGVDFDWTEKRVYWSDVMTDKIQRAMFDGSHIETIVTGGLISAEGQWTKHGYAFYLKG